MRRQAGSLMSGPKGRAEGTHEFVNAPIPRSGPKSRVSDAEIALSTAAGTTASPQVTTAALRPSGCADKINLTVRDEFSI